MTGLFLQPEGFYQQASAVLEPEMIASPVPGFPERGISCFSRKLVEFLKDHYKGVPIAFFRTEEGKIPIYKISWEGEDIALFMSRVGAPAAVIQLEEVRAMGLRKIFYFGSCGALDRQIGFGDLILPLGGIRDGCLVVEMEYTALQAAADFRKMEFGQLLYCEDNLDSEDWEGRGYLPGDPELMERWLELPFRIITQL